MMIYLVRRYVDALPHDEYGVDDNYTLIGAFTDPVVANNVKERAQAKIEAQNQVFHRTLTQRLNGSLLIPTSRLMKKASVSIWKLRNRLLARLTSSTSRWISSMMQQKSQNSVEGSTSNNFI